MLSSNSTTPKAGALTNHTPDKQSVFFPNLDGIRFLAFLLVLIQHAFFIYSTRAGFSNSFADSWKKLFFLSGGLGVSIFFVLSGFLITYLLLDEYQKKGSIQVFRFYMRRVLRIWPLYYAVVIFCFHIYPLLKATSGESIIIHNHAQYFYTFLSNFDVLHLDHTINGNTPMIAVTWSVAIEEQFYLIWPLLFYILPQKLFKFIFPLVISFSLGFRFMHRDDGSTLYLHTISVVGDLAVGGFCAYYAFYSKEFKNLFKNLSTLQIASIYLLGIAWLVFQNMNMLPNYISFGYRIITTIFFAFIILEQNYSRHSFYKFSKNTFFSFWGKYTYGLYLLHQIVMVFVITLLHKIFKWPELPSFKYAIITFCICFLLVLPICYLSYEYFEKWFLRFKSRFSVK
jgi:peptidoglycan/LPS O-acetylase OafA/YrhL